MEQKQAIKQSSEDVKSAPEKGIKASPEAFPPDAVLMQRIVENDNQAFSELVSRYSRKLFATCFRMLGQYNEAEEAVQESFLKIWNYADKWDGDKAGVSTWIYTITTNTCRDALRKRKAVFVEHEDGYIEHQETDQPNGQNAMEQKQQADLVKEAIDKLPERQKQALILSYYDGLSHKEIGEIMDATAKSIEGLVARARNDLKESLAFMQEVL
jgi:RNA polymerase sigma-70 factor (ECF subfamily)